MKLISGTKTRTVMEFDESERWRQSFIFSVSSLGNIPESKQFVVRDPRNHRRTWTMGGKRFFDNPHCIGDVVLLRKSEMNYHPAKRGK